MIDQTDSNVDASLPTQPTMATSSHITITAVHLPIPAHVTPTYSMLPVHTAVTCGDQLGGADKTDSCGSHDGGGVRVCNSMARLSYYTETASILTNGTATAARDEHECDGDYGGVSDAEGDSVVEIVTVQPTMMCEGVGCEGVSEGVIGTTGVLPLQSEDSACSTWEQDEKALSGWENSAQSLKITECKQGQPNLGAG